MRTAWVGGVGGVLVISAVLALANPFRWIGLGDLRGLWLFMAAVGFGLLCVTCVLLAIARRGWWGLSLSLAAAGLVLAALAATGAGLLALVFVDLDQRVVARSGDGRFVVIVHDTSNIIDPVEGLYVQTTNGPFSRRAYLGCFNSDSGGEFESVRFTGTGTVVVKGGAKQWTLRFDADNVRTIDTVEEGMCSSQLYTG